ncbi:ich1-like protein [Steccherinum ochraceum]|uniref:Ich1-like protein n=1 Tax=Steccherinum ochraceum TaxID=92696 RepID=A0A4R0RBN6_9APHY|nr:ich1-like protein [Steccherinum ochraceum]
MTFATLRTLHAIIGTAIDDIERVYRPDPSVVPSSPPCSPTVPVSPKPERPPRSPRRVTHLPSPPSPAPSSPSRSPSPAPDSDCSHTIDIGSLPSPISVKFGVPPKSKAKQRSRAKTLPTSVRPLVIKHTETKAQGPPVVLDWPDLDEPFVSQKRRPAAAQDVPATDDADSSPPLPTKTKGEMEEELMNRPEVINAVNRIVAACAQLCASTQRPFTTLCDASMSYHLPSCLRFLEASHTVEILRDAGPRGLHVKKLAHQISQRYASGIHKQVDPGTLSHILRLLATHHITREVRPDVFANNRLSSFMDSGKDVSDLIIGQGAERKYEDTDGIAAFVGLCADELFKASAYLTDCYLLPGETPYTQTPLSPALTSPGQASSPVLDRRTPRQQDSMVRAHIQRPSDASSISDTGGDVRIRSWDDDDTLDGPATPKTPRTSPNQQASSPSVASQASLTPPTFAPNRKYARKPSLSLTTQNLAALLPPHQQQHLSSPFSLRRQPSKLTGPELNASLTSLSSNQSSLPYTSAPSHISSTQSLISLPSSSQNTGSHTLLPPVSIPTHKPSLASLHSPKHKSSLASLASPTHKSSMSSLSSATSVNHVVISSPLALSGQQLSPVREKMTPSRKKSQGFLRRIGSKSILGPAFTYGKEDPPAVPERVGAGLLQDGGYMRDNHGMRDGLAASPRPSLLSLRSPGSLLSLRRLSTNTDSPLSPLDIPAEIVEDPCPSTSTSPPPPVPPKPMHISATHPMFAPFNLAFQTTQPYFEWLEQEGNLMRLKRFGKAMTGTSGWEVPGAILDALSWEDLPQYSVVVDVGGGIGSTSILLAKAFKHLRFVVQDRDPVVEMGISAWKTRCPELLSSGQAAFQAHDFLTPQPAFPMELDLGREDVSIHARIDSGGVVGPPAVYLLRVITHDWPDEFVTRILLHLRNAAGPHTKLLIADHLLPLACVDEDDDGHDDVPDNDAEKLGTKATKEALPGTIRTLAPEGSPLLPNLGKANANAYWMDLTMKVTFNSQERTLREIAALTLTAGWKVVHVSRAEGSLFGHIVAVPVDIPPESLALLKKPEDGQSPVAEGNSHSIDLYAQFKLPDPRPSLPPAPSARSRSGTITSSPVVYSPPMGDTFFSNIHLPSDEVIHTQTRLFRFGGVRRSRSPPGGRRFGLGLGSIVASASEGWTMGGRKGAKSPTSGGSSSGTGHTTGRRKRSNTVGASASAGREREDEDIPPVPSSPLVSSSNGKSPSESSKKGWKSLRKMLSRPHLASSSSPESRGVGGSPGSGGSTSSGHGRSR